MAPVTRSTTRKGSGIPRETLLDTDNESDVQWPSGSTSSTRLRLGRSTTGDSNGSPLQSLLKRALGEAKDLERENETLRMKVIALESKLDRITADDDVLILPRRGNRNRSTIREVKQLKKQVKRLEKSNEKYRKKIHQATVHWLGFLYLITLTMCMQLSMKELENEAEDLVDVAEFEVGDSAHKMRKLLQNFHDLMLANSLEEGEQCMICFEQLQPRKCRSLICQHTFCDECVRQIQPEPDAETESIRCPQCRGLCPKDEMEVVEFTASEQWDALLDVAKRWAKMDVRREQATTEEEDAEDFIDDDLEGTSSTAPSEPAHREPSASTPEPLDASTLSQTLLRLRRRPPVARSSEGTEDGGMRDDEPGPSSHIKQQEAQSTPQQEQKQGTAESVGQEHEDRPPPPSTTAASSTSEVPRPPPYSQSPSKDKRRMLEQLAETRNKKRRY